VEAHPCASPSASSSGSVGSEAVSSSQ
jgi:hypothetical protein